LNRKTYDTDNQNESTRKSELLKTPITKLKKIAKKFNVSNLSKYKKANIEELVEEILKKENK
jgi:hypothetical protein